MDRPVVFISYSPKDKKEKDQLLSHLNVLRRIGSVELWSEDQISAGADWQAEISQVITKARVAILLITANLLSSEFISDHIIPPLLERREQGDLIIFPVIARSCAWEVVDWLNKMQVRPGDDKPVWGEEESRVDKALADIAKEIAALLRPIPSKEKYRGSQSYPHYISTTTHYVRSIPIPPAPYVVHHYSLLRTPTLIGRRTELQWLTDWATQPNTAHILNIVAIGGMGKSALTWRWFNDIAPKKIHSLAGRLWWSFYESEATFDNFINHALMYITGKTKKDIENSNRSEREAELLNILDQKPFLLVLDGLERIMNAYRTGATHLVDEDEDPHWLRKMSDWRVGHFLSKLATGPKTARILISTRLYPAELEIYYGCEKPGCKAFFLSGLNDNDALDLWRSFNVSGSQDTLLALFKAFENHPLLIQVLAGAVANYPPASGDFDRWQKDNPSFDPVRLPLIQFKSHILKFARRDLALTTRQILETIAAFHIPISYDTLIALLVGADKVCANKGELYKDLTDLEDRGLIGRNQQINRYECHPIIRETVWNDTEESAKQYIFRGLVTHYSILCTWQSESFEREEELIGAIIEWYSALIGLNRYDEAYTVFYDHLQSRLGDYPYLRYQRVELLGNLFADGLNQLPSLKNATDQAWVLRTLAADYDVHGKPVYAVSFYGRQISIHNNMDAANARRSINAALCNLAYALRQVGPLRLAETVISLSIFMARKHRDRSKEALGLKILGLILMTRGSVDEAETVLLQALEINKKRKFIQSEILVNIYLAQRALWLGDYVTGCQWAEQAWALLSTGENEISWGYERGRIQIQRLQGTAAIGLGDLTKAEKHLDDALALSRSEKLVEEEIATLIALAELRYQQREFKIARELLEDVRELAKRGDYLFFQADACNKLAQIARDEGNQKAAITAATTAYHLAWGNDGPPFAYHWGLEIARTHLIALNSPEPKVNEADLQFSDYHTFALQQKLPLSDVYFKHRTHYERLISQEMLDRLTKVVAYWADTFLEKPFSVSTTGAESFHKRTPLTIDTTPLFGNKGRIWQVLYTQNTTVAALLDTIWNQHFNNLPAFTYGQTWFLRDANSGHLFTDIKHQSPNQTDYRSLEAVNIRPGMKLELIPAQSNIHKQEQTMTTPYSKEQILRLIDRNFESLKIDYKREYPLKDKGRELIKDVIAMANTIKPDDTLVPTGFDPGYGFIIIGWDEKESKFYDIAHDLDDAKFQQIVNERVEPKIDFLVVSFDHEVNGKTIRFGAIIILPHQNPPHRVSKPLMPLKRGDIFIRRGTSTDSYVSREELELMLARQSSVSENVGHVRSEKTPPNEVKANAPQQKVDTEALRDHIADQYSLQAVKTLCDDCGIDYDELGESQKTPLIRELIRELKRQKKLTALIEKVNYRQ